MKCILLFLNTYGDVQPCVSNTTTKNLLVTAEYTPIGLNKDDHCVYTAEKFVVSWPYIEFVEDCSSASMESLREVTLESLKQ